MTFGDIAKFISYHLNPFPDGKTQSEKQSEKLRIQETMAKAEQGDATCQFQLGMAYLWGEEYGLKQDVAETVKWWRKSVGQDFHPAEYQLGEIYLRGYGDDRMWMDRVEGMKLLRKAAEHGNPDAQVAVGRLYLEGVHKDKDYSEAVAWFRKAAELGHSSAHYILGECYRDGKGVDQNYSEAYAWFNLAKDTGCGSESRDELEKLMSPQQVFEAQKRSKELRAQVKTWAECCSLSKRGF